MTYLMLEQLDPWITLDLSDPKKWEQLQVQNEDGHALEVMQFAENWARLMQAYIGLGRRLRHIADISLKETIPANFPDTMPGQAAAILQQCWMHGPELWEWFRDEYSSRRALAYPIREKWLTTTVPRSGPTQH